MALVIAQIDHIVLNCAETEVTAAWFQRVLGMAREDFSPGPGETNRIALKFGNQKINLRPTFADKQAWIAAKETSHGAADVCFVTKASLRDVIAHLEACDVPIELGPVERLGAMGPMRSVYCRDPDGDLIEIASYSPA
ncbi:MAG: VOC family protein [Acetobacteraceae bacterium]|nr:VOC family protein [Acetobacteraceae bacterium]